MNLVLALGRLYIPASFRQKQLRKLVIGTAAAFRREPPAEERSLAGTLRSYALFTKDCAEEALRRGEDEGEIRARLFQQAQSLGGELRKMLCVNSPEELRTALRLIYRVIGIDAAVDAKGVMNVKTCYFSSFYDGRTCRLISALDAGVAAGLSGGGRLVFSQRITEGHECCRARLEL